MGDTRLSTECFVMTRCGLKPLSCLDFGSSVLDVTGEFAKVESITPTDLDGLVGIKVVNSQRYDSVHLDTPYITYNNRTGEVCYVLARNLKVGMCLLSVKPTMKYAKTCYSMDMQDFVTGFGRMKHVTINKVAYTVRPITDICVMENSPKRGVVVKLKHAVTMQTSNGIIKSWSV